MWCLCNDHCLDIVMCIWSSINFPIVVCLPTICYFSREKPLVKPTAPGSSFSNYLPLRSTFHLILFSDLLIQKPKNILLQFILIYLFGVRSINLLQIYLKSVCLSWGVVPWKGLTTPLTGRVARCCYLCACAVYVVLLGSPTSSITLVSYLRELPTATVLHHPFLFGEIPT